MLDKFATYEKTETALLDALMAFCTKEHIRCMSPLSDLASALDAKKTIFKPVMDGHPTAAGYNVLAESVYTYLQTEQLLK